MREFILRALTAKTSPDFNLNDLSGSGGRMDLVTRCVSNSLFVPDDLRRDTVFNVVLEGADSPPKIISFNGRTLKNLAPDERNIASHIKHALSVGLELKLGQQAKVSEGISISKKSF